ncbi:MAG: hypothetical protein JO250_20555 [Armatimonadetes bacterium]|nr:hypothetical protein [Armatimonadota bacterium]
MTTLLELEGTPTGSPRIFVEVHEGELSGGIEPASPVDCVVEHARQAFDAAMESVKATVQAITQKFNRLDHLDGTPDEYEVEFGLKLTAESGVIITSGGVEANFRVTLRWK